MYIVTSAVVFVNNYTPRACARGKARGHPASCRKYDHTHQLACTSVAIPTRSRYAVRTPPRSLDDMDGRGWEVRDGLRMVSRVSVEGAGRSGDGLQGLVSRVCDGIRGLEGLGGLGLGCEWLAGLVWEGLGYMCRVCL